MAIAWFFSHYKTRLGRPTFRYCAIDDYTSLVEADGGKWDCIEVLGDQAIVKVRASGTTLATIALDTNVDRIPVALLNDPLSTLTTPQKNALKNKLNELGYTNSEITARFGGLDLSAYTLADVLRFAATRRKKVDHLPDFTGYTFTSTDLPCESVDYLDTRVQ